MDSKFLISQGAGQKLEFAFQRNGGTARDLEWLSAGDNLKKVMKLARGEVELRVKVHIIDCDAEPFLPEGLEVEGHRKCGKLTWDPRKVSLYLSPDQKYGRVDSVNKLREELKSLPVLNANVLDYLLAHPELIPEEWKDQAIFFWGTLYRGARAGRPCVRFLYWYEGRWIHDYRWLDIRWSCVGPAAVLAS